MIIYSVTVNIDDSVHDEWVTWMKEVHIPDVMATGYFLENRFACPGVAQSSSSSLVSWVNTCLLPSSSMCLVSLALYNSTSLARTSMSSFYSLHDKRVVRLNAITHQITRTRPQSRTHTTERGRATQQVHKHSHSATGGVCMCIHRHWT